MSKDLTDALDALSRRARESRVIQPRPQPRGAAPRKISAATPVAAAQSSDSSGSIASPLTEVSREYHSNAWRTTDGLFEFPAIKKVTMTDADGRTVVFNFSVPE